MSEAERSPHFSLAQMFEAVGRAVMWAQAFETLFVIATEFVRGAKELKGGYKDFFVERARFKGPTKNLLKKLSDSQNIDPALEARIARLVENRHELVHRWFVKNGLPDENDQVGIAKLIKLAEEVEMESKLISGVIAKALIGWHNRGFSGSHQYQDRLADLQRLFLWAEQP